MSNINVQPFYKHFITLLWNVKICLIHLWIIGFIFVEYLLIYSILLWDIIWDMQIILENSCMMQVLQNSNEYFIQKLNDSTCTQSAPLNRNVIYLIKWYEVHKFSTTTPSPKCLCSKGKRHQVKWITTMSSIYRSKQTLLI